MRKRMVAGAASMFLVAAFVIGLTAMTPVGAQILPPPPSSAPALPSSAPVSNSPSPLQPAATLPGVTVSADAYRETHGGYLVSGDFRVDPRMPTVIFPTRLL